MANNIKINITKRNLQIREKKKKRTHIKENILKRLLLFTYINIRGENI